MSIDRSLKVRGALERHRNILSRAERIEKLKDEERWKEGDSLFGLPKVAHRKSRAGKKTAEEKAAAEAAKAEAAAAGAVPAAGAATPAAGKAGAKAPAAAAGAKAPAAKAAAPADKKKK